MNQTQQHLTEIDDITLRQYKETLLDFAQVYERRRKAIDERQRRTDNSEELE